MNKLIKKIILIILSILFISLIMWIIYRIIIYYQRPDCTTYKTAPGGKMLIKGSNGMSNIRFTPDSKRVIFIEGGGKGKGFYFLKEFNLKTDEIKKIYTQKYNYENGIYIGNMVFIDKDSLLLFDELYRRKEDRYRIFKININKNYEVKKIDSPIQLVGYHKQSQQNRKYFYYKYGKEITIIKYPHILKKLEIQEELRNQYPLPISCFNCFDGFGRTGLHP